MEGFRRCNVKVLKTRWGVTPPPFTMKNLLLLLLPFSLFAQPQYDGATYMGIYGNYYYYVSDSTFSFWDAKEHVRSIDSTLRLVSIHSEGENRFICNVAFNVFDTHHYLWIGGDDYQVEGQYVWDDGSPFNYSNWGSGEPNNSYDSGEDYIMLNYPSPYKWNDATNTGGDIFHYVFKVRKPSILDSPLSERTDIEISSEVTPEVNIYPTLLNSNITEFLTIDVSNSLRSKDCKVWLNDGSGKMVLFNEFVSQENNKVHLPIMANGLYHGVLLIGKERYRFKVVVVN